MQDFILICLVIVTSVHPEREAQYIILKWKIKLELSFVQQTNCEANGFS